MTFAAGGHAGLFSEASIGKLNSIQNLVREEKNKQNHVNKIISCKQDLVFYALGRYNITVPNATIALSIFSCHGLVFGT